MNFFKWLENLFDGVSYTRRGGDRVLPQAPYKIEQPSAMHESEFGYEAPFVERRKVPDRLSIDDPRTVLAPDCAWPGHERRVAANSSSLTPEPRERRRDQSALRVFFQGKEVGGLHTHYPSITEAPLEAKDDD